MKNIFVLAWLMVAGCALGFAQSPLSGHFQLNGQVAATKRAYKAILQYTDASGKETKDSTLIKNGRFTFKGILQEPVLAALSIAKKTQRGKPKNFEDLILNYYPIIGSTLIFLEPTVIKVSSRGDSLPSPIIKGGHLNTEYLQLQKRWANYSHSFEHLDSLNEKIDTTDHIALKQHQDTHTKIRADASEKVYKPFLLENLNSFIAVYALQEYATKIITVPDKVQELFQKLPQKLQKTPSAREVQKQILIAKATNIGQIAPDFTAPDGMGKPINLYAFRGKYILLDFWASWCMPCRGESPFLLKAYQHYKNNNFTILSVSTDKNKMAWLEAVKEDKMDWPQVSDLQSPNKAAALYGIKAIPQNFLIDPQGKIIAKNLRGEDLESTLNALIRNK